jgi:phytoene/squalene synthetase
MTFGLSTPERVALSDDVCIALQVVEHMQDVAEDFGKGRVYLPLDDLETFGCSEEDLAATHASFALRRLLASEAGRARDLLASGPALAASMPWRERMAVCAFTAGGLAALDAMREVDYDVLAHHTRPRPARAGLHVALVAWRALRWAGEATGEAKAEAA